MAMDGQVSSAWPFGFLEVMWCLVHKDVASTWDALHLRPAGFLKSNDPHLRADISRLSLSSLSQPPRALPSVSNTLSSTLPNSEASRVNKEPVEYRNMPYSVVSLTFTSPPARVARGCFVYLTFDFQPPLQFHLPLTKWLVYLIWKATPTLNSLPEADSTTHSISHHAWWMDGRRPKCCSRAVPTSRTNQSVYMHRQCRCYATLHGNR